MFYIWIIFLYNKVERMVIMEKMNREHLLVSEKKILESGKVLAVVNAQKGDVLEIMMSGLLFKDFDYELVRNIEVGCLCSDKISQNGKNANVVIELSSMFFKELLGANYEAFWKDINSLSDDERLKKFNRMIQAVASISVNNEERIHMNVLLPSTYVRGAFVVANNDSTEKDVMDNLTYVDNVNFYDNLDETQRMAVVAELKQKFSLGEQDKNKLSSGKR